MKAGQHLHEFLPEGVVAHPEDSLSGMQASQTDLNVSQQERKALRVSYLVPINNCHANSPDHEALDKAMELVAASCGEINLTTLAT